MTRCPTRGADNAIVNQCRCDPNNLPTCPCTVDPMSSTCGVWEGNESACVCAELGLEGTLPP